MAKQPKQDEPTQFGTTGFRGGLPPSFIHQITDAELSQFIHNAEKASNPTAERVYSFMLFLAGAAISLFPSAAAATESWAHWLATFGLMASAAAAALCWFWWDKSADQKQARDDLQELVASIRKRNPWYDQRGTPINQRESSATMQSPTATPEK